jgi:hypothetical protein
MWGRQVGQTIVFCRLSTSRPLVRDDRPRKPVAWGPGQDTKERVAAAMRRFQQRPAAASRPTRQWWITYPVRKRGPEFRAQDSGNGWRLYAG